ncbi:MAG: phospho-N-acetylmuramoyl-pentapeptide-transferase [Clostridiaceae bacterium]
MDIIISIVIALAVGLAFGPLIIKKLKEYKLGQQIRKTGPQHQKKQGTPTMGGLIFMVGITVSALIMNRLAIQNLYLLLGMMLFGLIGFIDDTAKIRKQQSLGLDSKQKIALNIVFGVVMAFVLNQNLANYQLAIPVLGTTVALTPVFYFLFMIIFYTAVSNSVNLADGIDGLCGTVTLIVAVFYIFYGIKTANPVVTLFAGAMTGALAAYLFFNWHPARVFMGDTGSFALGGALATMAVLTKTEILFILIGSIYVIEAVSDILQISSIKLRGKRMFLMAPIHHHFEKKGWSETKIVGSFALVTVISVAAAYLIS